MLGHALTVTLLAAASQAAAAAVPVGDVTPVTELPSAHAYRSGVVVGFSYGGGLGGASGYPNNAQDIGNQADYSASGVMGGTYGSLFVMGAFSDYVSFGFWFGHSSFQNADFRSSGDGGGLRVEAFPLVGLVPPLHGLGVLGVFGVGSGHLDPKPAGLPGSSGTQSFVGAGPFYEWSFAHVLGGHLGAGPSLEYDAIFSRPFESHGLVASLRLVFYGGP
ncbi:MAG TPA: hypothetical protein VGG39_24545 [Polyangiaceae bacterium]|jgi:hypothetical protein